MRGGNTKMALRCIADGVLIGEGNTFAVRYRRAYLWRIEHYRGVWTFETFRFRRSGYSTTKPQTREIKNRTRLVLDLA